MKERLINSVNSSSKKENSKSKQLAFSDNFETNSKVENVNLSPSPTAL
jgi:hypothetical protein